MSGRLIILPKKSYCPWNKSNVERVLRDERQHAEAQEREESLVLRSVRYLVMLTFLPFQLVGLLNRYFSHIIGVWNLRRGSVLVATADRIQRIPAETLPSPKIHLGPLLLLSLVTSSWIELTIGYQTPVVE
jgi:hypothetical protein